MKNRIPELRTKSDLTQDALARMVETSRQTIISLEKGRYDPGLRLAMRLAQVFDVAVEDVFILDD